MKSTLLTVFIILACVFGACKSDSSGPSQGKPQSFSLKISVKDEGGNPAQGLRISVWNHVTPPLFKSYPGRISQIQAPRSASTIGFEVPVASRVDLAAYEMDGRVVASVLDNYLAIPGGHVATLSLRQNVPTRVYKCRFVARDTASGSVLFRDSIYAVLWQPDASISVLGWTGVAGTFETADTLFFPNLLVLPPMVHTNWNPDPMGTFTFSDSVTITVTDTSAGKSQQFERVVRKGANDIQLSWNPAVGVSQTTGDSGAGASAPRERNAATMPFTWRLHQNYPNPFD